MLSRTQAIRNFLQQCGSPKDLVDLYTPEMECHVNVKPLNNKVLKNQEYKGHKYNAYQDLEDGTIYKPFRIPWDSMKETAYYTDPEMTFDLKKYCEGIGMTGWNFVTKQSFWFGYDFDSMINHGKGLTDEDLEAIRVAVYNLDYVTVRKSTTGSGLHIYVFVDPVETKTHTEHQSLARAILDKMSLDSGYELQSKVDQLGAILWVWATKMEGTDGLTLLKKGGVLKDIPLNWKAHEGVINRKTHKIRPDLIVDTELDDFNKLAEQRLRTPLDDKHRKIIEELGKEEYETSWNSDYGMLITHTKALENVHKRLTLAGPFSTATSSSSVKNCFCFPMPDGAWSVRRHGRGVVEASTWMTDLAGWTYCFYNKLPDFKTACITNQGVEDTDGGYVFEKAEFALIAAKQMGINLSLPEDKTVGRGMKLKMHTKTKKLIAELDLNPNDSSIPGWIKKTKVHQFMSGHALADEIKEDDVSGSDEIRHCVTEDGQDAGWYVLGIDGQWNQEPRANVLSVISSMGFSFREREAELGRLVTKYWRLVKEPFQPEYLGNRTWNKRAAQLVYKKKEDDSPLVYTHWTMILDHLGAGLDVAVNNSEWCEKNGITTGSAYLKCWMAALIQYPKEPLPYLFFYGKEDSGKSIFHEAFTLLLSKKSVCRIDSALQNPSFFNGEIADCVLGVVEETNLSGKGNKFVLNKMKDWVTSRDISIHFKGETPYMATNIMHMVHTSNEADAVPVFPGDTRVVVCQVSKLKTIIAKPILLDLLKSEGQDFTTELLNLELPKSPSRLRIPVVESLEKIALADSNMSDIERFATEHVFHKAGSILSKAEVYDRFCDHFSPENMTQIKFNRVFQSYMGCLGGRYGSKAEHCWGNVSFDEHAVEVNPVELNEKGFLR